MKMENTGMYFEKILFERNTIPILKGSLFGQILFERNTGPKILVAVPAVLWTRQERRRHESY